MKQKSERIFRLEKKSLRRVLGVLDLFSVGYGDVGSSIYYALGATALYALGATPLALLAAGFVFICTAFTYSEMAATFPEPGGAATFTRYAFNDLISFIAGWGLLLDYIVTIAISSFAIPPYLQSILRLFDLHFLDSATTHCIATVIIIWILFIINLIGIKESGRVSSILAFFTIITQFGIILLGAIFFLDLPTIIHHLKINVPGDSFSPSWWDFAKGCSVAMVAYTGIEAITQLAAETKKPSRSIPKAIQWTAAVVLFLYVGLSTVSLSVLSPHELGTTYLEDPISGVAENFPIGGKFLGPWVGLLAAIILLIAANAGLIGCSRLLFSMGEYYQVPAFCYKIHPKFHTPYVTLIIFALLASFIVMLSRGKMLFLVDIYNFGAQMAFFSVHMALLVLRWKQPHLARPYKAPLNISFGKGRDLPLTAIIGALVSLLVWLLVVMTKWEGRVLGSCWIFVGLLFFFWYRHKTRISPTAKTKIEKIKVPTYRPTTIKNLLVVLRSIDETKMLSTAFELAKLHQAKVSVVYVLEVPHALPIDGPMVKKEKIGEIALQMVEAIAREYHLQPSLELVRSRSFSSAVYDLEESSSYDLIIAGSLYFETKQNHLADQAKDLIKGLKTPLLFCRF